MKRTKTIKCMAVVVAATVMMTAMVTGCGQAAEPDNANVETEAVDTGSEAGASVESADANTENTTAETDNAASEVSEASTATDATAATDAGTSTNSVTIEKVDPSELNLESPFKQQGGNLPAYEYPGPELFYLVVYDYVTNVLGKGYLPGDVTIPCVSIVAENFDNNADILVYGFFEVYNYTLSADGKSLMTVSGGNHPGLMHLKSTDAGYEVTGFDAVEDGSNYEASAKKIFGNYYDDFQKISSDDKAREATRAQIISNYAAANNLPIDGYQDYGWDKIALPTENIDSFYSDL